MKATVVAAGADGPAAADHLRSLDDWLVEVEDLRGRVGRVEGPPRPGTLGPALEALTVAVGPGGVAAAFAATVIAWLRHRHGDVRLTVTLSEHRSVELTATNVADLDGAALQRQVAELVEWLHGERGEVEGDGGR